MWVMWRSVAVVLSAVGCGSAFVLGERKWYKVVLRLAYRTWLVVDIRECERCEGFN